MYVLFLIAAAFFYCDLFEASKLLDLEKTKPPLLAVELVTVLWCRFIGFAVCCGNPPTAETVLWTARPLLSAGDDRTE